MTLDDRLQELPPDPAEAVDRNSCHFIHPIQAQLSGFKG
jgi:hypothetical protein